MIPSTQAFAFGSSAALARDISPEVEKTVLQLIVDGFERWRADGFKRFGEHEDHYTVRLVACMKQIRRERNIALMPRYQFVEPTEEMFEGHEDPAHARRIDMVVAWDLLSDDVYLSVECKRLAPDDLARLYVVDGMDRFVQGYYGADTRTGAMVGYIISGTTGAVLKRVNHHVLRALTMGSGHTLTPANPVEPLHTVFASLHSRSPPLRAIRLTHLFFDMNKNGSRQAGSPAEH